MAYPFLKSITFDEFLQRLKKDFKCEIKEKFTSSTDTTYIIYRNFNKAVLSVESREDYLTWSQVRNVCVRLDIEKKSFGLSIE